MSDGLIGLERDVILQTLIQDKSPIMISPVVKKGVRVESMTLQPGEYKIYPQGILFFKRFLSQWKPIDDLLRSDAKVTIRMTVSFYHRGRGLFFISALNLVQKGYALTPPVQVFKMDDSDIENANEISGSIFREGVSGIFAKCVQIKGFMLFENRLWMNFPKKDFEHAKEVLKSIAKLEDVVLLDYSHELICKTKLLMYLPDKKLPEKNHFPYPVTITQSNREILSSKRLAEEIGQYSHNVFIPLCESPRREVHSIVGLMPTGKKISPSDINDTLLLLSVSRYLANESKRHSFFSSHVNPLSILCITDTTIVFGFTAHKKNFISSLMKTDEQRFPLSEGQEYTLKLHIPVEKMIRTVLVTIVVAKVYINDHNSACALCSYVNLQEEDRRFLYEKFTKTKLH